MKRAMEASAIILAITIFISCGGTKETSPPPAPEAASSKNNAEAVTQQANSDSPPTTKEVEDTPVNRRKAAERYLRAVPPVDVMRDMTDKIAETLPAASREKFKQAMTQVVDIKRLEAAMTDSMVKRFTVAEIDAVAKFYGSPEGKSVMKKFGLYMADIMPAVQAEAMKAAAKAKEVAQ